MSQKITKKSIEMWHGLGHVTRIILAYPDISPKRLVLYRDFKFGTRMHNSNVSKADKTPEKGRDIGHVTLRIFGIPSDGSPKPVNISANHCLKFCKFH